jgi:hypothetical protein
MMKEGHGRKEGKAGKNVRKDEGKRKCKCKKTEKGGKVERKEDRQREG